MSNARFAQRGRYAGLIAILALVIVSALGVHISMQAKPVPTNTHHTSPADTHHTSPADPQTPPTVKLSAGWHITTYYTPVESYHNGSGEAVTGCLKRDCADDSDVLGVYPSDFVEKVKNEGAGRITRGVHAGSYLNWSYDTGYWLDEIPSDSNGNALQPFHTAAADSGTLPQEKMFRIASCGSDPAAIDSNICRKLEAANWVIADSLTPGVGGPKHIDLYIGEENAPDFEDTNLYVDLSNVSIQIPQLLPNRYQLDAPDK